VATRAKTTTPKTATTRAGGQRPKRTYSRDFTPARGDRDPTKDPATWGAEYKMSRIPRPFWRSVQAKAKREGVSLRWLLLSYLQAWVNEKAA
jgi:hypothetical protein